MVKVTELLTPAAVVTLTLAAPAAAVVAMLKVAVISVEFTTTMLVTVPAKPMLIPTTETKLVPVSVTGTVAPCAPLLGVMEMRVGNWAGAELLITMLKVRIALSWGAELSATVTVTMNDPEAVGVPLNTPAELRVKPGGSPVADQV